MKDKEPGTPGQANRAFSAREECGEELLNPGMNSRGKTGAGAGAIPPCEAEADAATSREGVQAGTQRDRIHKTEDNDPATARNR